MRILCAGPSRGQHACQHIPTSLGTNPSFHPCRGCTIAIADAVLGRFTWRNAAQPFMSRVSGWYGKMSMKPDIIIFELINGITPDNEPTNPVELKWHHCLHCRPLMEIQPYRRHSECRTCEAIVAADRQNNPPFSDSILTFKSDCRIPFRL